MITEDKGAGLIKDNDNEQQWITITNDKDPWYVLYCSTRTSAEHCNKECPWWGWPLGILMYNLSHGQGEWIGSKFANKNETTQSSYLKKYSILPVPDLLVRQELLQCTLTSFLSWDLLLKGQCHTFITPVFFMILIHPGPLFICWNIFPFGFACAKNSSLSLTSTE